MYPWHGWWHIGWVVDYLLAEAHVGIDVRCQYRRTDAGLLAVTGVLGQVRDQPHDSLTKAVRGLCVMPPEFIAVTWTSWTAVV